MKRYVYDIELLRNLFTVTFINVDDEKDEHIFYIGLDKTDYSDLLSFLSKKMILIGYNNHSYDDAMLRFVIGYKGDNIIEYLYKLSNMLVTQGYHNSSDEIKELRYPRKNKYPWKTVDLMRILAFDKLGISLKQTSINLKWHKVQDMPIDHTSIVTKKDLDTILSYNINDVLITKRLYEEIEPIRKLREELGKLYSVDLSSASDSKIANILLENIYSKELNMDIRKIRHMRTPREKVWLKDCIADFVGFKSPELKDMLNRINATIVYKYNNYKYSEDLYFANCAFKLGVGGLHTEDAPGIFETDDEFIIQDMDVASYYPNLIINNNFYPDHLGPNFIKVLKRITEERLDAKKNGDKIKADGLKITINSIFGKLGSEYFWLLDPKKFLSTTLSGQMGLLMLIEGMHLNGIEIISANTDGVVCKIPRTLEDKYYEIAKKWEEHTGLELEYTLYKKYIRRDVNSYITIKESGKTKEKGVFTRGVNLKKAYRMPIVPKALYEYFVNDIPIEKTIRECKDIMMFCISQKTGANFQMELHTTTGIEELQKTNRYYISTKGGSLIKRYHLSERRIGLNVGYTVQILNDYDKDAPFDDYNVNFYFYEKEALKIVDEIEPKQMELFSLSSVGNSSLIKAEVSFDYEAKEEENTIESLNKLGKNQIIERISTIAKNNEIIKEIDKRYVYVSSFEPSRLIAYVYCLAKGSNHVIYIDEEEYKRNKIEENTLVYCTKFEKKDYGHSLVKYKTVNNIHRDRKKLF